MKILVTGGAGFIGSHLVKNLLANGHTVTVLDNLDPQVHGNLSGWPPSLPKSVRFLKGDVTELSDLKTALEGQEAVAHLAATVGVGQSMYEVSYYTHACVTGTARLYEAIIKNKFPIKRIVVASSMSAYGEGLYQCPACKDKMRGWRRSEAQMSAGQWNLECPKCKKAMAPVATPETEPFKVESVYALAKRDTEELALILGRAHGIASNALRFFNVYGPGQSLSNPYTGVLAIFMSRVVNNNPPVVYEDGAQSRDFVHVSDVAEAIRQTLESTLAYEVMNVGSGEGISIKRIAELAIETAGKAAALKPEIKANWRPGDTRHCFADISKIQKMLPWKPKMSLSDGLKDLFGWSQGVTADDKFEQATKELSQYGLLRSSK